jgi:hypothetical protein
MGARRTLRLNDLDPATVANKIYAGVRDAIDAIARKTTEPSYSMEVIEIGELASQLVVYAQSGVSVAGWDDLDRAREAVERVCGAYFLGLGAKQRAALVRLVAEARPCEEVKLAIRAAKCRIDVSAGTPVSTGALAALAGLANRHVRSLVRKGVIATTDGRVSAAEARRWLASRGIPGC